MGTEPRKRVSEIIFERMPEILPQIMKVLDDAEASGEGDLAEIKELRTKAEAAWDRQVALGKLPPR